MRRREGESSLVSGGCAVGEVVNKGGNALEAPAQEAEINFKLNLADRMLDFEAFRGELGVRRLEGGGGASQPESQHGGKRREG